MLHQKEILQWLKMFSVNQIKHFLTIKNPKYQSYIERIMKNEEGEDSKPSQRWMHGYSQQSIKEITSIYRRDNFRYKKAKEKKKAADECFYENITVSRVNPYSLSVRKEFIKNGKLSECMLIISDEQIFNCYTDNYQNSAWFDIKAINSLSMWIIRLFELEIFDAYSAHENIHSINHFVFAEQCITREKVKNMLQNSILKHVERSNRIKNVKNESSEGQGLKSIIQISKEEGPYLLQRCIQKLEQEGRDIGQIIFQDIWCIIDHTSKVNRIYKELYLQFMEQYDEYLIDVKCQEIQSFSSSKKKKKKPKKAKQEVQQPLPDVKPEPIKLQKKNSIKPNTLKQSKSTNQVQETSSIQRIKKEQKAQNQQVQKQTKKLKQPIKHEQSLQQINQKKLIDQKEKQEQKKFKKIINQRINENIQSVYDQLYESSQSFDKYRKICFEIIRNTIEELKIAKQWKLELFGSASIDFALKESDLDLVLIIDNQKQCNLKDIQQIFKVKKWLKQCTTISQTKVPIVKFEIILSQIKHPKIKEYKKALNNIIHVDISISYFSSPHEGLKNTQFLKEVFGNHPNLMIICLILKELLRINQLNKPYKGGISSYVLVILVYNILKMKDIEFSDNLTNQLKTVAKYMSTQFQPFITLITPFENSKLKPNSQLSLNIEDPHERILLHTSARLINQIISLFKQLYYMLEAIQFQMAAASIEERKRMKKIFFENWNTLFRKGELSEEKNP